MLKKGIIISLVLVVFSMFFSVCFAEENSNSVSLGNEIMKSVDKTGESAKNLVSGNTMRSEGNMIKNGVKDVSGAIENVGNNVSNKVYNTGYNTARTTTEGTTTNNYEAMTTSTWMWIILIVAAIVIFAAIWYYATQNNG